MSKMPLTAALFVALVVVATPTLAAVSDISKANSDFGFKMYKLIAEQEDAENIFFSPYSISTALALTYLGARGKTRTELADVLGFSDLKGEEDVKMSYQKLIEDLFAPNDNYILKSANKFYGQDGWDFESDFSADLHEFFKAETQMVDFSKNAEAVRQTINAWVEAQTENTIKDLFPSGTIDSSTILALVNALYFKADWLSKFDPDHTMNDEFHLLDDSTVSVPMMELKLETKMKMDANGTFTILELPYKGDTLAMYIVLPKEIRGLEDAENVLNSDTLTSLIDGMTSIKINLHLPKFKVTQQMELPQILKALGIRDAFSSGLADFSGISKNQGLYINEVVHQAYISIDEEGTEASAATGVAMSRAMARNFNVNHPFVFFIRDKTTSSNLFMGRVVNPDTATKPLKLRMMRSVGDEPTKDGNPNWAPAFCYSLVAIAITLMITLFFK